MEEQGVRDDSCVILRRQDQVVRDWVGDPQDAHMLLIQREIEGTEGGRGTLVVGAANPPFKAPRDVASEVGAAYRHDGCALGQAVGKDSVSPGTGRDRRHPVADEDAFDGGV